MPIPNAFGAIALNISGGNCNSLLTTTKIKGSLWRLGESGRGKLGKLLEQNYLEIGLVGHFFAIHEFCPQSTDTVLNPDRERERIYSLSGISDLLSNNLPA